MEHEELLRQKVLRELDSILMDLREELASEIIDSSGGPIDDHHAQNIHWWNKNKERILAYLNTAGAGPNKLTKTFLVSRHNTAAWLMHVTSALMKEYFPEKEQEDSSSPN